MRRCGTAPSFTRRIQRSHQSETRCLGMTMPSRRSSVWLVVLWFAVIAWGCGVERTPEDVFRRYVHRTMPSSVTDLTYREFGSIERSADLCFTIAEDDLRGLIQSQPYRLVEQDSWQYKKFVRQNFHSFYAPHCPLPQLEGATLYFAKGEVPQLRYLLVTPSRGVYVWSIGL